MWLGRIRPPDPSSVGRPQQKTLLTCLPQDLRNRIYDIVLMAEEPINIVDDARYAIPPATLQVCHQVRSEAIPMYHSSNDFSTSVHDASTANNAGAHGKRRRRKFENGPGSIALEISAGIDGLRSSMAYGGFHGSFDDAGWRPRRKSRRGR